VETKSTFMYEIGEKRRKQTNNNLIYYGKCVSCNDGKFVDLIDLISLFPKIRSLNVN
jgi:hypothetical protein